jgi:energy-coupling factor transporter ATP-binding protein EcfA2
VTAVVKAESLTKRFGEVTAVADLSFVLEAVTITGFLGPNGAGKTTTLRMVLGLASPTNERGLVFDGPYAELERPALRIGAVVLSLVELVDQVLIISRGRLVIESPLAELTARAEYRYGTIRPTFLFNPARSHVLTAKVVVGALAGLAFGILGEAIGCAIGFVILDGRGSRSPRNTPPRDPWLAPSPR